MRANQTSIARITELSWLSEVEEYGPRLSQQSPVWVRRLTILKGPGTPHPERHPYCELGIHLSGCGVEFVERCIRPAPVLRKRLLSVFREILGEFEGRLLGREFRLRALLMDMLVDLARWEREGGREATGSTDASPKWQHVNRALHYLKKHF